MNFDLFTNSEIRLIVYGINNIPNLNLTGSNLVNLEYKDYWDGGESFWPNVSNLNLTNLPDLVTLDLSPWDAFTVPFPSTFPITNIGLINAPNLKYIYLDGYQGDPIDFSFFPQLQFLSARFSNLSNLDLSYSQVFKRLLCNSSAVESVKICSDEIDSVEVYDSPISCLTIKGTMIGDDYLGISAFDTPNLNCIEVEDWEYFTIIAIQQDWDLDPQISFSNNCNNNCSLNSCVLNLDDSSDTGKNLIQILDMMGRETSFKPNTPLIYVYDDGSIEKVFSVEY